MTHNISHKFKVFELLRFALPSIIMVIFLSIYTIIDGLFIVHYIGTNTFAAANMSYPVCAIVFSIALMLGTGGSATVANLMGKGKKLEARQFFTFIFLITLVVIGLYCIIGSIFLDRVVTLLGANDVLYRDLKNYLRIELFFLLPAAIQSLFICFFVTASRPKLGLFYTFLAGASNIILDYVFIVLLKMGVEGAALATGISYCIPAVGGIYYFTKYNSELCFARPRFRLDILKDSCFNGSSEMTNNLSSCVITYIFNITIMRYAGADGVAAITVILYCQFLLTSIFIGYSIGVAPIISYHCGAKNTIYFKHLIRICVILTSIASVLLFAVTFFSAEAITSLFVKPGTTVFNLAFTGLEIFSFSIIFTGLNIFYSAALTAVTKGKESAIISLSRSIILIIIGMYIFEYFFKTKSIWLSIPFAETGTILITIYYISLKKKLTIS